MPRYQFAMALGHQPPFAFLRADLPHDAAAVAYARTLDGAYREASSVIVACEGRVVATVPVNPRLRASGAARQVQDSRALIEQSRRLLEATRWANPDEGPGR